MWGRSAENKHYTTSPSRCPLTALYLKTRVLPDTFAPTRWPKDVCNKYDLDIVYKESPYTLWRTAPPTYEVVGSECTVTIGRRGMTAGKCRNYGLSYFKS